MYSMYSSQWHNVYLMSNCIIGDLIKLKNICWSEIAEMKKKKSACLEQSSKADSKVVLESFFSSTCSTIESSLCSSNWKSFWIRSVLLAAWHVLQVVAVAWLKWNLFVLAFRWSEAHHQTEALGPFWSLGGKIRVVPRRGSCLHRLLTTNAGADPREKSDGSRVSQAPLA